MRLAADIPSMVVSLDPTPRAGAVVKGMIEAEGHDAPHATLSSAADLLHFLAERDTPPGDMYYTLLVNVEEFDLVDLARLLAAAGGNCLVVALHRQHLDPDREDWVLRAGGIALRAGPTSRVDIESLSRLAYGRALRPAASSAPPPSANLLVFLCHSADDKVQVRNLYRRLTDVERIPCWLDEMDLLPGQEWEPAIHKALRRSSHVLVCLTRNATEKRGFLQKELRLALDEALRQPEGSIFLIPVRLEQCEVPDRLSHLHCVDLFQPNGIARLADALRFRRSTLGERGAP